jgi:phenylalanyl-tRNA synthetase alpha chain
MIAEIEALREEINTIQVAESQSLENYRLKYLSKNGIIATLFENFKAIPGDQKKAVGQPLNQLKQLAEAKYKEWQELLERSDAPVPPPLDVTLPPVPLILGSRHPINLVKERVIRIFQQIGFSVADGPEIEDEYHNFGALNFPPDHPARDMQDTFFVARSPDYLLRTHTSTVQVRLMENTAPPLRAIMPGRVYRNEAISARAHCLFHQIEGIYINKGVSFIDLKDTIYYFVKELFGADVKIRFRPSYFPFTEPSAEVDIDCRICHGEGCNICKNTGWVEIAGSGMIHPNVLATNGIDNEEYTGFAFGMGIERIAMLLYDVKDLRWYTENDVRFLRQFAALG